MHGPRRPVDDEARLLVASGARHLIARFTPPVTLLASRCLPTTPRAGCCPPGARRRTAAPFLVLPAQESPEASAAAVLEPARGPPCRFSRPGGTRAPGVPAAALLEPSTAPLNPARAPVPMDPPGPRQPSPSRSPPEARRAVSRVQVNSSPTEAAAALPEPSTAHRSHRGGFSSGAAYRPELLVRCGSAGVSHVGPRPPQAPERRQPRCWQLHRARAGAAPGLMPGTFPAVSSLNSPSACPAWLPALRAGLDGCAR